MYSEQMAVALRKAHKVLYGTDIEILMSSGIQGEQRYQPVSYVAVADPRRYEDLIVAESIRRFPGMINYMIIIGDRLDFHVREAIEGRDHIKPITIVWSMALKVIWDKVRMLHRLHDASLPLADELLTGERIASCLPAGFEFINPPVDVSNEDIIDVMLGLEFEAHCSELALNDAQIEAGIPDYMAERVVIAKLALQCNGEGAMLHFLKRCYDLTRKV